MKRNKALIDNNIFVYHYLGYQPIQSLFKLLIENETEIVMSSIVAMEFLSYDKSETNEMIMNKRYDYITAATTWDVDLSIAEKALN